MARAEGRPSGVAVATVIALASTGSLASASAIHSRNRAKGSVTSGLVASGMGWFLVVRAHPSR